MKTKFNKIKLNINELKVLDLTSNSYLIDSWDFVTWVNDSNSTQSSTSFDIVNRISINVNEDLKKQGFVLIDLDTLLQNWDEGSVARIATFIVSLIGKPIKIFNGLSSHWRKIGVNLAKHPNKSEGIGYNSLHIDFVNAEFPPDYVCLFTLQHDINGGGHTVLANIENIEDNLCLEDLNQLKTKQFKDGKVENLINIGNDINPFAVINENNGIKYRFTGNLLNSELSENAFKAIQNFSKEIQKRKITFLLKKGQLLIINQHKVLHGKEALGLNQENIPEKNRRLLMHSFLKIK